jgi:hypothetical protein
MSVKITFVNFTTKQPCFLENPTKDNVLEQATAVSRVNPECIYILTIVCFENGKDIVEEWRLRAGTIIFHFRLPNKPTSTV